MSESLGCKISLTLLLEEDGWVLEVEESREKMPNYLEKVTLQEGRRKRSMVQHTRLKTSINLIKQRKEKPQ